MDPQCETTVMLVDAVPPGTVSSATTGPTVLFLTPTDVPATSILNVQDAPGASGPSVTVRTPDGLRSASNGQVDETPPVNTSPAGGISLNRMCVRVPPGFEFVTVKLTVVVAP